MRREGTEKRRRIIAVNGGENTVIKSNEEKTKEKEERKGVEKRAGKKG